MEQQKSTRKGNSCEITSIVKESINMHELVRVKPRYKVCIIGVTQNYIIRLEGNN